MIIGCIALLFAASPNGGVQAQQARETPDQVIRWSVSEPFLGVETSKLPVHGEKPWTAIKDPSVVWHEGHWHLFCTIRKDSSAEGGIRIGYLSFRDWNEASSSTWRLLDLTEDYHGAPQIFFFRPHGLWYLVYQASDQSRDLGYGPCYSTNSDLSDPAGWTKPRPLYVVPKGQKAGLDFWVICDTDNAYVFFSTLDGRLWRSRTLISQFPHSGWTKPKVAIQADIFEAAHVYRIDSQDAYLAVIEAQAKQSRYFKGYVAERLDGQWFPLADTAGRPLAGVVNTDQAPMGWTDSFSHGEFIRDSNDERLLMPDANWRMLFQGVSRKGYRRGNYGQIPWQLGRLTVVGAVPELRPVLP